MNDEYEQGYQQCLADITYILEHNTPIGSYYILCDFVNDNCKEGDDND